MKTETYALRDGSSITIPVPTCYKDCIYLLKTDYYRIYGHLDNIVKIWLKSFKERSLKVLFWMRMASYKGCFYPVCLLIHNHYKVKYDCRVHCHAKIGYGLFIGHAISMCVSVNCIIGNNVNLSQMINIGTNEHNHAIIGDNVYIGPMTCIVEGVHIGNNSVIGAGSVVTRDVAADSTAVGVPAKVIGPNKHPEYVHNRWTR